MALGMDMLCSSIKTIYEACGRVYSVARQLNKFLKEESFKYCSFFLTLQSKKTLSDYS